MTPLRILLHVANLLPIDKQDSSEKLKLIAASLPTSGKLTLLNTQKAYSACLNALPDLTEASCEHLASILAAAPKRSGEERRRQLNALPPRLRCTELVALTFDEALKQLERSQRTHHDYLHVFRSTILWSLIALLPFALFILLRSLHVPTDSPDDIADVQEEVLKSHELVEPWYRDPNTNPYRTITRLGILGLVATAGAWGAFLNFHLTSNRRPGFFISPPFFKIPVMGALFGFIVFLLFASSLVEGRIFPTSYRSEWETMAYVPSGLFCLCLWSVIGGFAQDRITNILKKFGENLERKTTEAEP